MSRGRGIFCVKCGYVDCVCRIREVHVKGCKLRTSMECPVGIACEHGWDFCPKCDPCTCAELRELEKNGLQPLGAKL